MTVSVYQQLLAVDPTGIEPASQISQIRLPTWADPQQLYSNEGFLQEA